MELSEVIRSRRTVHEFSTQPLSEEIIKEAIALALMAPNHRMTFPWLFYWLSPSTQASLAHLAVKLKAATRGLSQSQSEALKKKYIDPPVTLILGMKKMGDLEQQRENYAAVACGVQNLSLYLWSKGIGSKWSTGAPSTHAHTYELLGVNGEQVELLGLLWIGIAARVPQAVPRPPLTEVLFRV